MVTRVYGHAQAMTLESHVLGWHNTNHAASPCPVSQHGTIYQQSLVSCHHNHVSVAIWKL